MVVCGCGNVTVKVCGGMWWYVGGCGSDACL